MTNKAGMKAVKRLVFAAMLAVLGLALTNAQTAQVRFYGPLSRVITPNGDRINDIAFFCFENPQNSDINGKIYTLLGTEVASTGSRRDRINGGAGSSCPPSVIQAQFVTWDGTAENVRVRSGLYVYRFTSENQVFTGTMLVAR